MPIRETSLNSYYLCLAEDILGDRELEVYAYIHSHPDCTDQEIAKGLNQEDPNYVRPRRRSLVQYGLIIESGKRPSMYSPFRESLTWKANPKPDFAKATEVKKGLHKKRTCPFCSGKGYLENSQVKLGGYQSEQRKTTKNIQEAQS